MFGLDKREMGYHGQKMRGLAFWDERLGGLKMRGLPKEVADDERQAEQVSSVDPWKAVEI